ncbi:enoyl-CoA delta isomerase 1, mitochondrial-like [Hylaeus volcanicus]|uniref:enoyl-CoA delta isomerase 1, mitochondrial-like n=1 Tax=Hylaeus volcanicus TaxID=313075 RepID=UPI0023B883E5|nr:enoyl-CoA delta isomerase 1, mitochondrial-like [Hylaeus volcanicus]XP_053971818.1 enoyl-CoA delta isomerase 1, mitochondrial-like [Hylaeus volcanicus]XP_053971819.1 enoyl-CoA delta isomerase 1, mitochondrial-like [Hylaeus volcanicus]
MFAVRRIFSRMQMPLYKSYTTNSKLVEVTHEDATGITTISMARPPVNCLDKALVDALTTSLMEAQKNQSKGVILTSSLPSVFSAGIDIMEMYNRSEKYLTEYWTLLQDMWLTLYGLEIPVAAAINGASPAGGCMLAISCEYRVLVEGKHTIGLNETKLGMSAPTWFKNLYIDTIGYRKAELALLKGTLFQPKEALEIGLVDELVADKTSAIKKCEEYITSFKKIPALGLRATKKVLRTNNLLWLKENRKTDLNNFLALIQVPSVQAGLKLYIESLKKK